MQTKPEQSAAPRIEEVYAGYYEVPGQHTQRVDFSVPAGASRAEKDAAFLAAMASAQGATFDYLEIGNQVSDEARTSKPPRP